MIASKYYISQGKGTSKGQGLPSFDKALLEAGVGNYNLVRLSSILPAKCKRVLSPDLKEGSLLPTAYSTISSSTEGETIVSTIGVGIPENENNVGVIMEYSTCGFSAREENAKHTLRQMIEEAFEARGWGLKEIIDTSVSMIVGKGQTCSTFACIAEWWEEDGKTEN